MLKPVPAVESAPRPAAPRTWTFIPKADTTRLVAGEIARLLGGPPAPGRAKGKAHGLRSRLLNQAVRALFAARKRKQTETPPPTTAG